MRKRQPVLKQEKTLNPELKTWLYASGSLTQQLTELGGGQFSVKPFKEHFQRLTLADSQWMNMPHAHTSWVRETYLYGCEAEPWVKAKSIFPIQSLQKRARIFQHIGSKPIGFFYFKEQLRFVTVVSFVCQKAGRDKVAILGMDVNLSSKKHSYRLLKLF